MTRFPPGVFTPHPLTERRVEDATHIHDNAPGERSIMMAERVRLGRSELMVSPVCYGLTLPQLILAATLTHPAVHCVIVGIKTPEQIEDAAGAMGKTIEREDYFAIRNALAVK